MAEVVWDTISPRPKENLISMAAFESCIHNLLDSGRDPFNDPSPSMVVRPIPSKSDEAKTPESKAAVQEELNEHKKRGT